MLKFLHSQRWPKAYGFEVFGKGPTYVVSVEPGSTADKAGLKPGDQILELEGQDVTTMSANTIKTLARQSRNQPPALEVVACVAEVVIDPVPVSGYGFSVLSDKPVVVGSVDFTGPAQDAGLRVGDIILEVNQKRVDGVEAVGNLLIQRPGRLRMVTIPVGRTGNLVHVDKGLTQLPSSDPRVHRAKDLYDKLGDVLGDDYERKMAVVAVLKQYAEDRDVEILCRSLDAMLNTPSKRSILKHIRSLVSPHQRPVFDDLLIHSGHSKSSPALSTKSQNHSPQAAHIVGSKRVIQVLREDGSFGFVVKGCNPAYIESVDEGGPAEKAGIMAGDFIIKLNGLDVRRCDHDHLVELLQDSGAAPTLQVLRCPPGQLPNLSPSVSLSSLNSSLSESSHGSDLLPFEQNYTDRDGKTFSQNAEYLLTSKERGILKRSLQQYELHRDVVGLYSSLESVLDTPSKCMLWKFILIHVDPKHRDYILHRVGLPTHVLQELIDEGPFGQVGVHSPRERHGQGVRSSPGPPQSFQHHIDFLLTSRERMQFKMALHSYQENHDLQPLVEVMKLILDTPSKGILWRYILPRLTPAHQGVVRQMLDMPDSHSVSGLSLSAMDSYIGSYDEGSQHVDTATNTEEDILYGAEKEPERRDGGGEGTSSSSEDENDSSIDSGSVSGRKPMDRKAQKAADREGGKEEDQAILKELLATRRAVEEVKEAIRSKTEMEPVPDYDDVREEDEYEQNFESRHFVTIIPVGYPGLDMNRRPFVSKEMNSPEFNRFRKFVSEKKQTSRPSVVKWKMEPEEIERDADYSNSDSEGEVDYKFQASPRRAAHADSLNDNALDALEELDAAMAAETSDVENSPQHRPSNRQVQSPPPVPVPPPPPPPPLPGPGSSVQMSETAMNVKRINWEKLDNKSVENTIWEQLCDSDLSDVIHYLELETQFSTKPPKPRDKSKKKEVCIMNSKKAYNISILLGHLKMTVSEIKQAIYLMDEETLTPELLRQLITYAPSKQEMAYYDAYTGEMEDLSKPDQFAYEVSQIHSYEQRLRSLLFKACFRERIEEMTESLRSIKLASNELRHSKKLARLLELILAMGNYMNKGNSRVGGAAGFRITFLTQLDITKTADGKSTFLHVLADTVYTKFPELLSVGEELANVAEASKVSSIALNQEIHDLRKGLQDISSTLDKIGGHGHMISSDHFSDIMGHFIAEATDDIQSILRLQASAMEEFANMVSFFGEDPHEVSTSDVFTIFFDFVTKFERAHRHNMMYKRH